MANNDQEIGPLHEIEEESNEYNATQQKYEVLQQLHYLVLSHSDCTSQLQGTVWKDDDVYSRKGGSTSVE